MVWWPEIGSGHLLSPWKTRWAVVVVTKIHFNPDFKKFWVETLAWCGTVHLVTGNDRLP
jgi:hypothetical protein